MQLEDVLSRHYFVEVLVVNKAWKQCSEVLWVRSSVSADVFTACCVLHHNHRL